MTAHVPDGPGFRDPVGLEPDGTVSVDTTGSRTHAPEAEAAMRDTHDAGQAEVDRVAEAIYHIDPQMGELNDGIISSKSWAEASEFRREVVRMQARAAIAAMPAPEAVPLETVRLQAAVTWLRDYAIGTAIAYQQVKHGGSLTQEQVSYIIGGIDGNMAVAMDRTAQGDAQ